MPYAAIAPLHWYGPACAALVADPGIGTMPLATPHQSKRAGLNVAGLGTAPLLRPYRCRNAALDVTSEASATLTPKRWVRTGLSVSVNQLTASDVEGALQNMKVEGGVTFVQAMRALLALVANNATGLDGSNPQFKSRDGSKTRIAASNIAGNRTITALDLD